MTLADQISKEAALEALVKALRAEIADQRAALEKFRTETNSIRYVSDSEIGQLLELGVISPEDAATGKKIYCQAIINAHAVLLRACNHDIFESEDDYWVNKIRAAVAAVKNRWIVE